MELGEKKAIVQKRQKNFKQIELDILLELIDQNKDTIECKKTDSLSQREKEDVWKKIEEDFNKRNIYVFRDWKTLKAKYDNIKKVSKKAWAEDKKYVMGTGGGPSKSLLTDTDIKIKQIVGTLPIDGHRSVYDSDCVDVITEIQEVEDIDQHQDLTEDLVLGDYIVDHDYGSKVPPVIINIKADQKVGNETTQQCRGIKRISDNEIGFGTKYGVSDLRAPVSSSLNTSKKKRSSFETSVAGKRMEDLTKAKLELVQLQKAVCEEQREIQRVEHELKVKCVEEEHKLKMKNANEEHFLKIALLKLKIKQAEQELSASKIV